MHYNLVLTRSSSLIEDIVSDVLLHNSSETQISREKNNLLVFAGKIDKLMREVHIYRMCWLFLEDLRIRWIVFSSFMRWFLVGEFNFVLDKRFSEFFKKNYVALLI